MPEETIETITQPTPVPAQVVIPPSPTARLAYSMAEASQVLGVSYLTVHRLLKRGLIRSSSATRKKLIPRTELERFLKATLQ